MVGAPYYVRLVGRAMWVLGAILMIAAIAVVVAYEAFFNSSNTKGMVGVFPFVVGALFLVVGGIIVAVAGDAASK